MLFDLDDTLLDNRGIEVAMLAELQRAAGEELPGIETDALVTRFRGVRNELYERVLAGDWDMPTYRREHLLATLAPWGVPSEALIETAGGLREAQLEQARFSAHAAELLQAVREAGARTALLTNGLSWMQRRKVELLSLEARLDALGISEELGVAKPDPAAYDRTLALLAADPSEAVMVGDDLDNDVRGAMGAGLRGAVWLRLDGDDDREPPAGAVRVDGLDEVAAALAAFSG